MMNVYDIKNESEWNAVLDALYEEVGMAASLTDPVGKMLQVRGDRYPLCAAIRANEQSLTFVCSQTNTVMLAEVKVTLEPTVDECEVGLIRLVVPLVREGELVGQITACGSIADPEDADVFLLSKQLNVDEQEAQRLLEKTPGLSVDRAQEAAERLFAELHSGQ